MITVEQTKDRDVVVGLLDQKTKDVLPPVETWIDHPEFIYLVAKENDEPRLLALIVVNGTETQQPEIHLSAPKPWMHIIAGARLMKKWLRENTKLEKLWSFTPVSNDITFEFAKQLGFDHAFDEDNRRFIVLNLNN